MDKTLLLMIMLFFVYKKHNYVPNEIIPLNINSKLVPLNININLNSLFSTNACKKVQTIHRYSPGSISDFLLLVKLPLTQSSRTIWPNEIQFLCLVRFFSTSCSLVSCHLWIAQKNQSNGLLAITQFCRKNKLEIVSRAVRFSVNGIILITIWVYNFFQAGCGSG